MFLKSNKIYFYIILLFSFSCKKEPLIEKYKDVSLKDKKVYIPIRWVCQPGGALYLKKSKKNSYTLVIENERFMPIWDEYGKRLKPKAKESSILSRVELYFDDKIYKYKTQESIDNFIKGISKILKSDTILIDSK